MGSRIDARGSADSNVASYSTMHLSLSGPMQYLMQSSPILQVKVTSGKHCCSCCSFPSLEIIHR